MELAARSVGAAVAWASETASAGEKSPPDQRLLAGWGSAMPPSEVCQPLCDRIAQAGEPLAADDWAAMPPDGLAHHHLPTPLSWLRGRPVRSGGRVVGVWVVAGAPDDPIAADLDRRLALLDRQFAALLAARHLASDLATTAAQRDRARTVARDSETVLRSLAVDRPDRLYTHLLQAARQRARGMLSELASLSAFGTEFGIALGRDSDLDELLQEALAAIERHLHADFAAIWTLDPVRQQFERRVARLSDAVLPCFPAIAAPTDPAVEWLVQSHQPYATNALGGSHLPDLAADEGTGAPGEPLGDRGLAPPVARPPAATPSAPSPSAPTPSAVPHDSCCAAPQAVARMPDSPEFWDWVAREALTSFARYPLAVDGRLVGVLVLLSRQPLGEACDRMLEWAAHSLAVTLDRLWIREELLHRREDLMLRLASQIHNSLDLDTILQTAVDEIRTLLQIDYCHFLWRLPDGDGAIVTASHQSQNPDVAPLSYESSPAGAAWLADAIAQLQTLQVERANAFADSDDPRRTWMAETALSALLLVPLQTRAGQFGAVACGQGSGSRAWSESEVELLQAVVDQLAIAIDQAELYAQTRAAAFAAQTQAQQLSQALLDLKQTEAQLVQSEKMSGLGQMVAGVAHEINNPVSFIYGNLDHARNYTQDLIGLIDLYQTHYPKPHPDIVARADAIDLEFLVEDLPKLLASMEMGADRIREIVVSLRNFSRLDEAAVKLVDLHEGLDSTLLILHNRLKASGTFSGIEVGKHYGTLPPIECFAGQLNQVFMNVLSNAIDALQDCDPPRHIDIYTETALAGESDGGDCPLSPDTEMAIVRIRDNGPGIPEEVRARLFDPFFTTKPVGKGTGLGLSISYQIVVEKHGGRLACNTVPGEGSEFVVQVPVSLPDRLRPDD